MSFGIGGDTTFAPDNLAAAAGVAAQADAKAVTLCNPASAIKLDNIHLRKQNTFPIAHLSNHAVDL
ncbi:hypothetical protein GCM10011585_15550 [Edaphobacter dinghuensis]|uniref:Uncharacterized protein n=1 Tax=Edaphobacter dinghuensis TaxID=1560005 RepID=A0A917HBD4_9BACT|nr:hypothetical protein GCM10011585_15550 [Edaphobacter dinghuensis]